VIFHQTIQLVVIQVSAPLEVMEVWVWPWGGWVWPTGIQTTGVKKSCYLIIYQCHLNTLSETTDFSLVTNAELLQGSAFLQSTRSLHSDLPTTIQSTANGQNQVPVQMFFCFCFFYKQYFVKRSFLSI